MKIRKYITVFLSILITAIIITIVGYQYIGSYDSTANMEMFEEQYRMVKTEGKNIKIYKDNNWENLDIRGVELSGFLPQDGKISKELVLKWLADIKQLNVNVIKIPKIQPAAFYAAIDEYNTDNQDPIYIFHEVRLDEKTVLKYHNVFSEKLIKNFKKDIKNTINVIHGRALLINNKRGSSGLYLNDISKYNLGYILGANTSSEIISLTNKKHPDLKTYDGKHYILKQGSAFETFIAQQLDYAVDYEIKKHSKISLFSFQTSLELDPIDYKQESNYTLNARINMDKIQHKSFNNLFTAYKYHPNGVDFINYEYLDEQRDMPNFYRHLIRIANFYQRPLIIADTGISSSRGISRVDIVDGYNRGGFSEIEQGENLVELINYIDQTSAAGVIIKSWQDQWTNKSSFNMIEDTSDKTASSYWHNVLASDESFGLIKFEDNTLDKIIVDGDFTDWDNKNLLIDSEVSFKVHSDNNFLYLYLLNNTENIIDSQLFLGIDITPKSGSKYYSQQDVKFSKAVDFVVDLSNLDNAKVLVHKRYNHFNYLYKYYKYDVGKEIAIPNANSSEFSEIFSLNRKKFYLLDKKEVVQPIYYESGKLTSGSLKPNASDYNTLADFKAKDKSVEIRIPWALLNVINPLKMRVYDDFYTTSLESYIEIENFGFSIYNKSSKQIFSSSQNYKHKNERSLKYDYVKKDSYNILRDYWSSK